MTAIRSAIFATTPRSWVISKMEVPISFFKLFIRSRICACMVTSRAVVGSSANKIFGLQAMAMAIITR